MKTSMTTKSLLTEEWRDVPSYPGVKASSVGRLQLPDSEAPLPNGGTRKYFPKPSYGYKTKSSKTAQHVYMNVSNRKLGNLKVHRLVCEAFHGLAPFPKAVVIHLDEDGTNNHKDNLKWGTQQENLNASGFIEYCRNRLGENSPCIKGRKR